MPHGAKLLQWSTPLSNSVAPEFGAVDPYDPDDVHRRRRSATTPPNCGECSVAIPPAGIPDVTRRWPISWRGSISATFTAATTMQGEPILARSRAPLRKVISTASVPGSLAPLSACIRMFWPRPSPTSWRGSPGPCWHKSGPMKHASRRQQPEPALPRVEGKRARLRAFDWLED